MILLVKQAQPVILWMHGLMDLIAMLWQLPGIGFDQPKSTKEWGAQAALPMWIQFMQGALANNLNIL